MSRAVPGAGAGPQVRRSCGDGGGLSSRVRRELGLGGLVVGAERCDCRCQQGQRGERAPSGWEMCARRARKKVGVLASPGGSHLFLRFLKGVANR